MKLMKVAGACVVAFALLGVVGAATAAAQEAPEIGRCVKLATKTGDFAKNTCNKKEAAGKFGDYEFEPGFTKGHFTGVGGAATLETVHAVKVSCKAEASSGEYATTKTVANLLVIFTGCESLGFKCTTAGSAEGEIVTNLLAGRLVWEKFGKKVAIDLTPQSTELFAEFTCGPSTAKVEGSVMAPLPVDKMLSVVEEKFTAKDGKQKPEYYYTSATEKVKDVLMSKIGGGSVPFEQSGQTVTNIQTGEEALEVNTAE